MMYPVRYSSLLLQRLALAKAIGPGMAIGSAHGASGIDATAATRGLDTSAIQASGW